jgi:LacI family xylobiose transport system transcriptional regulator
MAATLDDVAKHSGYSPATISRVVNGVQGVSAEVRSAVEEAVRKLGYVPRRAKAAATPAAPSTARMVDVVLHRSSGMENVDIGPGRVSVGPLASASEMPLLTLNNDFYRHMLDGIVVELRRHEASAVLQVVSDLQDPALLASLREGSDGVLLVGEGVPGLEAFLATCRRPLVLVDIIDPACGQEQVTTDNFRGIGQAVDHLVELGHRRLGFIMGSAVPANRERAEAFSFHAHRHGIAVAEAWMQVPYEHIDRTANRVAALLGSGTRPTGIVCCNDWCALAVLRAAGQVGLRVPQDLSVVGFDDVAVAALVTPALTSVRVDIDGLGAMAARLLLTQKDRPSRGCVVRLPTSLVVRASTGKPPG